jgi:hypothetical protein
MSRSRARARARGVQSADEQGSCNNWAALLPCKYRHPRSSKKQLLINTANHDSPPKVIPRPPSPEQSRPSCALPSFPIHFLLCSLPAQSMTRPARSQSLPPSIVCG